MKRAVILTCLVWLTALNGIASADPFVLQVGILSFDSFIPADQAEGVPGVNAFNVFNFTSDFAAFLDPNASQALTFSHLLVALNSDEAGANGPVSVDDLLAPGQLLDEGGNPLPVFQWSDQITFRSASLQGDVDVTSFFLPDGSLFTVRPQSLSALLLPAVGNSLSPGDLAIIELNGERTETPTGVPEPSTFMLISAGLSALLMVASGKRRHCKRT